MTRVLVIGRREHGEKNDIAALATALGGQMSAVKVEYAYFDDFLFEIDGKAVQVSVRRDGESELVPLETYGHLIFLHWTGKRVYGDIAFALATYAEHKQISLWNSELLRARSTTKLSQMMLVALAGIDVPKTVFSLDHTLLAKAITDANILPVVCKDITASRGRYNELANTSTELQEVMASLSGRSVIAQAFIQNDGSDVRFVVTGGKVRLLIKRNGVEGSHVTNVSAGGQAVVVPMESVPRETLAEAEQIASLFGRELCGIDYMLDLGVQKYVFLEINGTPQIVNGVFVDEKIQVIADSLDNWLNNRE